jgi:hypothetical protein
MHVKGALVEIERGSTPGQQVERFVRLYPGWPSTYCCLVAGDCMVVLLAAANPMSLALDQSAAERREVARSSLAHALSPLETAEWPLAVSSQLAHDGEIYANYLVDIVRAILSAVSRLSA